jgi:hypothetical protein
VLLSQRSVLQDRDHRLSAGRERFEFALATFALAVAMVFLKSAIQAASLAFGFTGMPLAAR